MILDQKSPCICCSREVLTASQAWKMMQTPIAVCRDCYWRTPWPIIQALQQLRFQVFYLHTQMARIFEAQQQLEATH
jgi:hypothetical protein